MDLKFQVFILLSKQHTHVNPFYGQRETVSDSQQLHRQTGLKELVYGLPDLPTSLPQIKAISTAQLAGIYNTRDKLCLWSKWKRQKTRVNFRVSLHR